MINEYILNFNNCSRLQFTRILLTFSLFCFVFQTCKPTANTAQQNNLHLIERGGQSLIRLRDTIDPAIQKFTQLDQLPIDQSWKINATVLCSFLLRVDGQTFRTIDHICLSPGIRSGRMDIRIINLGFKNDIGFWCCQFHNSGIAFAIMMNITTAE